MTIRRNDGWYVTKIVRIFFMCCGKAVQNFIIRKIFIKLVVFAGCRLGTGRKRPDGQPRILDNKTNYTKPDL